MVEVKVFQGGSVATKDVDAGAFGAKVLGRTLKDAVVMYEANQRQGTVKAKTRSMVRGGNKKLWPQKHTGRARMGTTKSPIWRGGGRIHPPQPRDHAYHMPQKARRGAPRNALRNAAILCMMRHVVQRRSAAKREETVPAAVGRGEASAGAAARRRSENRAVSRGQT